MATNAVEISKLEDSAAGRALQAATQAPLRNFVEFTSTLVSNVFDTLVDNSIRQTRAYADLVASVAGTLADFEARTIGDPAEAAANYLTTVVFPTYGGTATPVLPTPPFATAPTISGNTKFTNPDVEQIYAGVTATIGGTDKVFALDANLNIPTAELFELTKVLLGKQAQRTYQDLKALVALGVQYIVIENGTLKTSLTFHTDSVDSASADSSNTRTDFENASRTFNASLARTATNSFGAQLARFHFGRSVTTTLGGSVNDSRYSSSLNVNVVNEKKSAVTNLSIDIAGSMELQFRTQQFPTVGA
jgi:hypothetical protein